MSFETFLDLFCLQKPPVLPDSSAVVWNLPRYSHHPHFLLPWLMILLSIPLHSTLGCVTKAVSNFSDILFLSAGTSQSAEWLLRELIHSAEC